VKRDPGFNGVSTGFNMFLKIILKLPTRCTMVHHTIRPYHPIPGAIGDGQQAQDGAHEAHHQEIEARVFVDVGTIQEFLVGERPGYLGIFLEGQHDDLLRGLNRVINYFIYL